MKRPDRFWGGSLRSRLRMTALAGLITTSILTALLLQTAFSALDVVNRARERNEWVQVNTALLTAVRDYQGESYRQVREPSAGAAAGLETSRDRFARLLDDAARLPISDESDRRAVKDITHHGRIVLEDLRHGPEHVRSVDEKWHSGGLQPALIEVNRLMKPIHDLDRVLRANIGRGHGKVVAATENAKTLIRFAVIASVIGMLLAVGCLVAILLLLEMRLRPGLQSLQEGVHAFRSGQLDRRIAAAGDDELARLSGAFNDMAATIQEKHQALREVQSGLERTIAERTSELQSAYAKLSEMDARRRSFLADVSHELRTPLTIIRGEAEVALRTFDRPGADPHQALERIFDQTQDLGQMVDELLLLALAEVGGLPLDRRPCDLQDIVARVGGDFAVLARDMGGSVTAPRGPAILALVDQDKMRRALSALVENALRHCQPGVNIALDVCVEGDAALISVSDDGPGIDPAVTEQLFQRFKRGRTDSEGSGLGLNLAHALIEAHDGRIALEARIGGGTRVILTLPLARVEMEAA